VPKYQLDVVEVRHVSCTYVVEANSPEEAIELAQKGETVSEEENGPGDVNDRFVNVEPAYLEPIDEDDKHPVDTSQEGPIHEHEPVDVDDLPEENKCKCGHVLGIGDIDGCRCLNCGTML
jgi:hypothetical protein